MHRLCAIPQNVSRPVQIDVFLEDQTKVTEKIKFILKVALQILGRTFYKHTKKSSSYSQSLLIFIRKTQAVETHPTTREIRDSLWPRSTPAGNTVYFYISRLFIYILKIHMRSFKHMENNYMFVMLWNLSVISQWIFPQCSFLFLEQSLFEQLRRGKLLKTMFLK